MSLRVRLAILVVVTIGAALGLAFALVYEGTGDEVLTQIDDELAQDAQTVDNAIPAGPVGFDQVERAARRFVDNQPVFDSRVYVIRVIGGAVATDEPVLAATPEPLGEPLGRRERRRRARDGRALRFAEPGYATVNTREAGPLRTYVAAILRDGVPAAYATVGEPLDAVDRAKQGAARTFALAGGLGLLLGALGAWAVAARSTRELRRMARTATQVYEGDLAPRIGARGPRDEVRLLAESFDRMLDRLEDAFERQRSFVADASHELRTPLTVVRGQLEVLARQADVTVEDVRRVEGTVRIEVLRMQRLVDDLLLLARADEGRLLQLETVQVDPFAVDLFDGLTLTADRDWQLGPLPGGTLLADADRLAQAVRNLARNAVEHTEKGGLVRLSVREAGPGMLEWAVEDDGPGIPEAARERIFDRFQRTDAARDAASGGAGLGLAIVRAIAEGHGGGVGAGVSPAGGARVSFTVAGWSAPPPAGRGSVVGDVPAVGREREPGVVPRLDPAVEVVRVPAGGGERARRHT